ncbi:hypothetical protein VCHA53O466_50341 [Vibrio chagasii]|nr:hypothetical protein VCHA53O466_50341 [Vibrio chagasii]
MIINRIISSNNALSGHSSYDYQMYYQPFDSSVANLWTEDREQFLRNLALGALCLCASLRESRGLLKQKLINGTDSCECYAAMILNNPKSDEEFFNKPNRIIQPLCDFIDELSQKLSQEKSK